MELQLHQRRIVNGLSESSPAARAFFALLCAERLHACCWAYQASKGVSLAPFFQGLEELFELLIDGRPADSSLRTVTAELEEIIFEGGEPLPVQAQSGVICLLVGLDMLENPGRTNIDDAARATVDALDNYDFFVRRRISNEAQQPGDFPLLVREMQQQVSDVEFLKNYEELERKSLIEYRIQNLQFAIPPAV
jgi:hypothetical protein